MKKEEFLIELEKRLQGLPKKDIEERLEFYSEMIDDRVEEGLTEDEAIKDIGGTDEAIRQITDDTPITTLVKEKFKPKKSVSGLTILLLILGFPLWLPLFLVLIVLTLVMFLLLWVLVIVSYSAEVALIGGTAIYSIQFADKVTKGSFNFGYLGIVTLGVGLSLLFIPVCYYATKATAKITKNFFRSIKRRLIGGKKNA